MPQAFRAESGRRRAGKPAELAELLEGYASRREYRARPSGYMLNGMPKSPGSTPSQHAAASHGELIGRGERLGATQPAVWFCAAGSLPGDLLALAARDTQELPHGVWLQLHGYEIAGGPGHSKWPRPRRRSVM